MFEINLSGFAEGRLNHTLFWFMVFVMALDVTLGYIAAHMRGEAVSQKLREGIMRRVYLMILVGLVTIVAAIVPEMSSVEIGSVEFYLTNFVVMACITAEFKSILEKAPAFGIETHPIVSFLGRILSRVERGKESEPKIGK